MFKLSKYVIAVLSLLSLTAFSQQLIFNGTADKKYDGQKIILTCNALNLTDSTLIKDGKYTFKVKEFKEPCLFIFASGFEMQQHPDYSYTTLHIVVTNPGTIDISTNVENISNSTDNGVDDMVYKKFLALHNAEKNKLQQEIMVGLIAKYGHDFIYQKKPDTSDTKYKEMIRELNQKRRAVDRAGVQRLESFIKSNPDSYISIHLMVNNIEIMGLEKADSLFSALSPKYKNTRNGKTIANYINGRKRTVLGSLSPDFAQPDTLGKTVKLSDFRGKYVFLDFWASWCGPCRAENPHVVKSFQKFKDKGFTVLSVSLDQPGKKNDWLNAIRQDNIGMWTHVSDLKFWGNEAAGLYGIKAIPANFLIDREGKIVAKDLRGEDLYIKLNELLGK